MNKKQVLFSGIKPSGDITLGNYLGAIKNWVDLQNDYDCYFSIVDLHAITVKQEPKDLRKSTLEIMAIYIASGIDIKKSTIFIQSHVPAHTECSWLLNCYSYIGELSRMTQYKDTSKNKDQNVSVGLFDYPVLMASDILLYQTDLVPVGEDQKQHIELTRDIATRFNNLYSPTFKIPTPSIPKAGARIMGLQDPTKKMSKSDENENGCIYILDSDDVIRRKINKAVTDTVGIVQISDDQLGVKNLINIYSVVTGLSFNDIEEKYKGKNYSHFKKDLGDILVAELSPIREKANSLLQNKDELLKIAKENSDKANYVAQKTLRKMKKKIGLISL